MIAIGKILVTVKNIHEFMEEGSKDFLMKKDMMLTPSAKDFLRNRNYTICFEGDARIPVETQIRMLLKRDFGITDAAQIERVVELVLKKLKN